MDNSEDPTRIHSATPSPPAAPPGGPGLTPHEPLAGGPGGPTDPPLPPTGGGGDGWDDGPDEPEDGEKKRNWILAVIAGALVLIALFLGLSLLQGDDEADKAETTTPAEVVESTPETTPATTPVATTPPATTPDNSSGNTGSGSSGGSSGGTNSGGGSSGGTTIDEDDDTDEPVDDGPLLEAGSVTKIKANQNDTVTFRVKSDVAEEIHVHGYDKSFDIRAGQTKTISFTADLTGIFEIEFEGSATQIGELTVEP